MSNETLAKVLFPPPPGESSGETLWAKPLGDHLFQLDNTPWFARGCALDDVVRCEEAAGELPRFVEVVRPSGNRTLRVFVPEGPAREKTKKEVFDFLKDRGYIFEGFGEGKGLIAITVPPAVDLSQLLGYLRGKEERGDLEWESGNF